MIEKTGKDKTRKDKKTQEKKDERYSQCEWVDEKKKKNSRRDMHQ